MDVVVERYVCLVITLHHFLGRHYLAAVDPISVIPPLPELRFLTFSDRTMPINVGSAIVTAAAAADSSTPTPIPEEEEFYSSWSLFLVCLLLILSLWTSYYLQIKKIRAIHETVVSIIAGMVVGFTVRLAPGHLIREMLVSQLPCFL